MGIQGKRVVSAEDFVRVWQTSSSTAEVASRTGMTRQAVTVRAHSYRQKGVKLKRFPPPGSRSVNVAMLNALAESLAKGGRNV